jgi:hypothetical protein
MFPEYSLLECFLNVPWVFLGTTPIDDNIMKEVLCGPRGNTWWTQSSTLGIRRLVLLTLVLNTHVGKLYSASTLVLFLNCFLQLDGGSRAPAQLKLNVPWMFLECSLRVRMLPVRRWRRQNDKERAHTRTPKPRTPCYNNSGGQ